MAGRRQHYLPRFLQRPFRYRTHQGQDYVHAHEGTRSYTPSTMGLGQERDFYGHPEHSAADDNITASETRLADIINRLNSEPHKVSQEDHARLIAALAVRTRKMREAMGGLVKVMAVEMAEAFEKQGRLKAEIESYWTDGSKLNDLVEEQLRQHPRMSREERARVRMFLKQQWQGRKGEITAQMHAAGQALAADFFSRMDRESAQVADNAFRKVFEEDPTLPVRVASLISDYHFSTLDAPSGGAEFVLGDCAAVGLRADGEARLPTGVLDEDVPMDFLFLPTSPTQCVVAARGGMPLTLTVSEINRLSASLSHRFFVSQGPEPADLQTLRDLIGTAEPLASEADVQSIMKSISDPA